MSGWKKCKTKGGSQEMAVINSSMIASEFVCPPLSFTGTLQQIHLNCLYWTIRIITAISWLPPLISHIFFCLEIWVLTLFFTALFAVLYRHHNCIFISHQSGPMACFGVFSTGVIHYYEKDIFYIQNLTVLVSFCRWEFS